MESISLSDDGEEEVNSKNSPQDLEVNVCMQGNTKGGDIKKILEHNDNVQAMTPDFETDKGSDVAGVSFDNCASKNNTESQDSSSSTRPNEPEQEEWKISKVIEDGKSSSEFLNGDNPLPEQRLIPSIPTTTLLDDDLDLNNEHEHCVQENSSVVPGPIINATPEFINNIDSKNDGNFALNQDKNENSTNVSENQSSSDDKGNSKVLCAESESDSLQLTNRILQLEEDRGKLTTEVMEKEILALKLEKETNYLRTEVSQLEAQHAAELSEIEKKHKQNMDQMAVKMAEVHSFTYL